ncbi:MAG: hypothetical protein HN936_08405 [Bacteroidetes bacterium]|jgi:hypothetical protein|nr:hypothetical protein [Bacteroidota bacterium]MBT4399766.1 hypothetical protein [Bacteroidota bacterium]MBT7093253.1 hypothetical protein [Bacteroidota bacterium]MBT7462948.1 hypothetical protein [Bacteroidota bacterium]
MVEQIDDTKIIKAPRRLAVNQILGRFDIYNNRDIDFLIYYTHPEVFILSEIPNCSM